MAIEVLIADERAEEYAAALADAESVRLRVAADITHSEAVNCEIILGAPDRVARLLDYAPRLKWVQSTWAGVDQLVRPGLRRDYVLTSAKGVFGGLMAEYVLCYLLMHERRVAQRWAAQRERRWDQTAPGRLGGKTLCMVGLGDIGCAVADQCRSLGVRVIGVNRSGKQSGSADEVVCLDQLPEALGRSDYVVSVLPETSATIKLFDTEMFRRFKRGTFFINIGRGSAVDQPALVEAVGCGHLGGAALDVFETEPLPEADILWDTPGVWVTCHTAAPSFVGPVAALFERNLRRFLQGHSLRHEVDFARGY